MSTIQPNRVDRRQVAVFVAVFVACALACSCFALSFSALWDVSTRVGWPRSLSWLGPVIVDGTILQCTVALVATTDTHQRRERAFFWGLLTLAAAASIGGNALHAVLPPGRLEPLLAAGIATIPAAFLLLSTHALVVILGKGDLDDSWGPAPHAEQFPAQVNAVAQEAADVTEPPSNSYVDAVSPFIPSAHEIRDRCRITTDSVKVAIVLHSLVTRPQLSDRTIAKQANVSHGTVSRIRAAAAELRVSGEAPRSESAVLEPAAS